MKHKILMIVLIFLFQFCVVTGEQDCEFQLGKKASGGESISFAYYEGGCILYAGLSPNTIAKDLTFFACMNYLYEKSKCKSKKNQLKIITYD